MAVIAKKLFQGALSATATVRCTANAGKKLTISRIFLVNGGATDRKVDLYQGGTTDAYRTVRGVEVPAGGSFASSDLVHVVATGETFAAKQDTGTDITMTIYGIEEDV